MKMMGYSAKLGRLQDSLLRRPIQQQLGILEQLDPGAPLQSLLLQPRNERLGDPWEASAAGGEALVEEEAIDE